MWLYFSIALSLCEISSLFCLFKEYIWFCFCTSESVVDFSVDFILAFISFILELYAALSSFLSFFNVLIVASFSNPSAVTSLFGFKFSTKSFVSSTVLSVKFLVASTVLFVTSFVALIVFFVAFFVSLTFLFVASFVTSIVFFVAFFVACTVLSVASFVALIAFSVAVGDSFSYLTSILSTDEAGISILTVCSVSAIALILKSPI